MARERRKSDATDCVGVQVKQGRRRDWAFVCAAALLISPCLSGCISKSKARLQAHAAFLAGQQQALMHMQQMQNRGPIVTILGQVKESVLPWTADLTLAKAIVAAGYFGAADPAEITITREGQQIPVDPKKLLGGEDMALQPRDVVELKSAASMSPAPQP